METWREEALKEEKESKKEERENDVVFCSKIDYRPYRIISTFYNMRYKIRESAVSTATGYGLDSRVVGVRVPVGSKIASILRRPDRFWGPPSLLSNGYREFFPRE
jgi:hypothetical protein